MIFRGFWDGEMDHSQLSTKLGKEEELEEGGEELSKLRSAFGRGIVELAFYYLSQVYCNSIKLYLSMDFYLFSFVNFVLVMLG